MDDDDDFLYGDSPAPESKPPTSAPQPIPLETTPSSNGIVEHLTAAVEDPGDEGLPQQDAPQEDAHGEEEGGDIWADSEEEEEEDDDVEIIMEPATRSLDFRQGAPSRIQVPPARIPPSTSAQPRAPQPSLTTEYTPIQRSGPASVTPQPHPQQQPHFHSVPPSSTPSQAQLHTNSQGPESASPQPQQQQQEAQQQPQQHDDGGIDPSTLPPVTAPPSHPAIDPNVTGMLDGRSILEVDLTAMAEKPWRRPGSDISDWFNYGFDEISWDAYCYRRRDLGELANVLKTNVLNFSGMPEDQLTALPPDVRQMVMTGTTAMMNGGGPNPGMMGPGVMMDMSMMGPMGMGMNGDMGMSNAMMQGMMQVPDGNQGQQGVNVGNGTPEHAGGGVGMMQDGFHGGPGAGGMMNMSMGNDFGMQEQNAMAQQMYPSMEAPVSVTPGPGSGARGGTPVPYRGRGMAQGGMRGRGFPGRGRGRGGGMYAGDGVPPPVAVRPASPLPPGVPTGPRNQNKYKDRDGNAPAVDGLDYGGNKDVGGRTPSGEPEERSSSRKRRSSPGLDDGRGLKRR